MRKNILAVLIAGLFLFGWTNCVNTLAAANATPIATIETTDHNYIGWSTREVMKKMGPPHQRGRCQIELPSGTSGQVLVMGDGAHWHAAGNFEGQYTRYIREMCAVYGIVVSETIDMLDVNVDGESTMHMGYTDYALIRKLLEAGPKQDGENGRYILKPGEMEI